MNNMNRKNSIVALIAIFSFVFLSVSVYWSIQQRMKEQSAVAFKLAFEKKLVQPLHPDTLNDAWQEILRSMGIDVQTGLNIIVTNGEGNHHSKVSREGFMCTPRFHMSTCIEHICGIEIKNFISYSIVSVLKTNWFLFFLLFLGTIAASTYFVILSTKKKMPDNVPSITEIANTGIIEISNKGVYSITPDFLFDSIQKQIIIGNERVAKISAQSSILLTLFLDAEDKEVTYDEIMNKLWTNDSGSIEKVHTVIKRLRKYLEIDASIQIQYIYPDRYRIAVLCLVSDVASDCQ